jgi:SNF2 family DNA or RNA helicase
MVPLSRQQDAYYDKISRQMMIHAADETITAVNAATLMNKLLQLSVGVVYSDNGDAISFDGKNRLDVLLEVIRETSNKILVFVPFKHAINSVSDFLTDNGITNEIISGEVTATKRSEIFRTFQQEKDPRVLVIQPQAAAHGVTLTAADTIIWFGPTTSLESYLQANARAHRKGQRHNVTVVHLQGSTVEAKVYASLRKKENVHSKVVELFYKEVDKVNISNQTGVNNE